MFEHENCYIGYHIIYNDKRYYVFNDDEKNLYMYEYKIYNDTYMPGFHHEGLVYIFDFENPVVIDKRHTIYNVHYTYIGFSNIEVLGLKDRLNIKDYDKLKKKEKPKFEFGDILRVKDHKHKLIHIYNDDEYVYYIMLRSLHKFNRIDKIKIDKVVKSESDLPDSALEEMLVNIELGQLINGDVYSEELKEELENQKQKYVKKG